MTTVTLYATGDQIGTFSGWSMSGNSNGVKVTLNGVTPLGTSSDVFRIEITQVLSASGDFSTGQMVSIYSYPDNSLVVSSLEPIDDQFQGRASSGEHQIFTSSSNFVIDVNGLTAGTQQYGPGLYPLRSEQFSFDALDSTPPTFPCFVRGTLIETDSGPLPIEILKVGDLVRTLDRGLQPIRWIGARTVSGRDHLAPVCFEPGSIGNYRRLLVSPQHRMLMSDWRSHLYFGEDQVFAAALHLVNGTTIRQVRRAQVTYQHMVFDQHEVVFAEGTPTESLHLGAEAFGALGRAAQLELLEIFPDLTPEQGSTARRCLRRYETGLIQTVVLSPAA